MNNYSFCGRVMLAIKEGRFWSSVRNYLRKVFFACAKKYISANNKVQKNKIMFMVYQNDYADNGKYIAEKLNELNIPCDIVWTVKNLDKVKNHFPANIRLVERGSLAFYKEAVSAQIWVDNALNFFYENVPKKADQCLINTWHGSMGLKRISKDDHKNKKWVSKALRCNVDTDYCVSDSQFETNVYRDTYWQDEKIEILHYGHPRNDILFLKDENKIKTLKDKICSELGCSSDYSIALYAPTFRDSGTLDCYNLDYEGLICALEKRFGGKWLIFARHHFHLWNSGEAKNSISDFEGVIRATDYDDMQELMVVADVGITDYSSWICDWAITNKPGFIFATDLAEYNTERGLYYPLETTPFPVADSNEKMLKNILEFDAEEYTVRNKEYLEKLGCIEDGHAAERVAYKIRDIMKEGK